MNAVVLDHAKQFRFADAPEPAHPRAGEALVRVRRVGICGTDWHAFHGRQPFFSYPRILGHELGVVVEAVNDVSSTLKPGDRCAVEPYLTCGNCVACRAGKTNCCVSLQCLGVHTDGGMRERIVVPASKLHKSESLDLDRLATVEMLGIGFHAVDRANVVKDEWALVIGAGPIGLSILPFARAAGARLIVADLVEARLRFCREHFGMEHTIHTDLPQRLREITAGESPTLIFDATGNAASMIETFDLVAPGGRIVFVGLFSGSVTFDDPNFHRREITLLASRNSTARDFTRIIRMLENGQIDTRPWITHRAPADEFVEKVPQWLDRNSGLIKAMVEF